MIKHLAPFKGTSILATAYVIVPFPMHAYCDRPTLIYYLAWLIEFDPTIRLLIYIFDF
jgi:hypothetical protein